MNAWDQGKRCLSKEVELATLSYRKIGEGNIENDREKSKKEDEKDD